jgi:hypothetical protein
MAGNGFCLYPTSGRFLVAVFAIAAGNIRHRLQRIYQQSRLFTDYAIPAYSKANVASANTKLNVEAVAHDPCQQEATT